MSLLKFILKFSAIALAIIIFGLVLSYDASINSIQTIENFWIKVRWASIVMVVTLAFFAYFSWEEIGRNIANKYNYPDAVLLFKELKTTIFTAFAVMLVLGVVL